MKPEKITKPSDVFKHLAEAQIKMQESVNIEDEVEKESPFCPLCKIGENHKDIKICKECKEYFYKNGEL